MAAIADDGLQVDELERAKVQVEAQTAYLRDSPAQVAAALGEAVSCADWRFYLNYAERISAVGAEDVLRVARTYLSDDSISVGHFVPRGGGDASTPGQVGPSPCHYRSEVASQVAERPLPGGARLAVLPRRHNPTVTLAGSLFAGHGMVRQESWTAASLIPDMLERGTRRYDRLDLARTLEDRGIELDVS